MLTTGHAIDELRMRDETVIAIGPNTDTEERLTAASVRLVVGDPRIWRVLSQAEVETASVIVLTGDEDLATSTPHWPPRS